MAEGTAVGNRVGFADGLIVNVGEREGAPVEPEKTFPNLFATNKAPSIILETKQNNK